MQTIQKEKCFSHGLSSIVVAMALWGGVVQPSFAATCGPGAHWVDSCTGGTDSVARLSGVLAVEFIGLGVFVVPVQGTGGVVSRSNPIDTPDALDPGHTNRINTELVSGTLNNITPIPGAGNLRVRIGTGAGVVTPSLGAITESSNPALASSYFDVFFEVDSALGVFHNNGPIRLTAVADSWLPDEGIFFKLDLANSSRGIFNSTNQLVAQVVDPNNNAGFRIAPVPLPSAVYLFSAGLLGLFRMARKKS